MNVLVGFLYVRARFVITTSMSSLSPYAVPFPVAPSDPEEVHPVPAYEGAVNHHDGVHVQHVHVHVGSGRELTLMYDL